MFKLLAAAFQLHLNCRLWRINCILLAGEVPVQAAGCGISIAFQLHFNCRLWHFNCIIIAEEVSVQAAGRAILIAFLLAGCGTSIAFYLQGKYLFKLLAVDVPTAGGSEQRLFLEGDEQAYAKGGIISELRDPFLQVLPPPIRLLVLPH